MCEQVKMRRNLAHWGSWDTVFCPDKFFQPISPRYFMVVPAIVPLTSSLLLCLWSEMLLNWASPTIPFPCVWGFFSSHPSWFNENCHRWIKTISPRVRQNKANGHAPLSFKCCFLRDKITTTATGHWLKDIWIHRLQQYFKNLTSP